MICPARRSPAAEDGFTLVEMVVTLVILPLVIGAAAIGVIAAQRNEIQLHGRIVDSSNAELTTANFVRDVQGATLITESTSATNPTPVCGTGDELLLGLARPNTFSVAYWWKSGSPGTIVRYACAWSTATPSSTSLISDDAVSTAAEQPTASILPSTPFGTAAVAGWALVVPVTAVTSSVALPSASITVASTRGFNLTTNHSVQIEGCTGSIVGGVTCSGPVNETISCLTVSSSTQLSNCTGGSGVALAGGYVSQEAGVSAVNLSLYQPATAYAFTLRAEPRPINSLTNGDGIVVTLGTPNGGPALLTLGSGVVLQGGAGVSVTVNGVIDTSSGTFDCGNVPRVNAIGYENTAGSSSITGNTSCLSGVPVTKLSSPTPDPLIGGLPRPMALPAGQKVCWGTGIASFVSGGCTPIPTNGSCSPGEYLQALPDGCELQPGVYILDAGYSSNTKTLSMAAGTPAGSGVLLYLPCLSAGCSDSISMNGNASIGVPPISAAQAETYFGSTDLADVVIWQDASDSAADTIGGNPSTITAGTIYIPSAQLTLFGSAGSDYGQIIALSVRVQGSGNLTVTPPATTQ